MNIFDLLGDNLFWLGTATSQRAIALSLMPEAYDITLREAEMHRSEYLAKKSLKQQKRAQVNAAVTAALTSSGLNFKIDSDDDDEDDDFDNSIQYEVTDNGVAILGINGPLVNSDSWVLQFMGKAGYPHIQDRLVQAYNDPNVSSVLLNINSPGGAVSGVTETADAIRAVNVAKPVSSFSANGAMSGAYWLASAGGDITGGDMAEFGSIGVIVTVMDYSKMLAQEGITPQIFREGAYKALVSNLEPLSDAAKAKIQSDMVFINNRFEQSVAQGRGVTQQQVHDVMGQGKTFWSQDAKSVGLIDNIGTLGSAVANSAQLAENRAQLAGGLRSLTF